MLSARGQAVASVCAGVSASHSGISASRRLVGSGSEAVSVSPWVGDVFAWLRRVVCLSRSFSEASNTLQSNRASVEHPAIEATIELEGVKENGPAVSRGVSSNRVIALLVVYTSSLRCELSESLFAQSVSPGRAAPSPEVEPMSITPDTLSARAEPSTRCRRPVLFHPLKFSLYCRVFASSSLYCRVFHGRTKMQSARPKDCNAHRWTNG